MELTALSIFYLIMTISALLYLAARMYTKLDRQRRTEARRQYQKHIDDLANDLFPTSTVNTSTHTSHTDESYPQEDTVQYREAKRKMVEDIRTYFNQRKNDAAIAKIPGTDELAPVNPSAGSYEDLSFPHSSISPDAPRMKSNSICTITAQDIQQ